MSKEQPLAFDDRGSGPVIVFLHSLGRDRGIWQNQLDFFSGTCRTVAVDLPGAGESPPLDRTASIAGFASAVTRQLSALGIDRAHWVGLSVGGMTALQAAADFPEAVASLCVAGASAAMDETWQTSLRRRADRAERDGIAAIVDDAVQAAFSPAFIAEQTDIIARDRARVLRNRPAAYADTCRAIADFDLRGRIASIACPVLIVVGTEDRATPPEAARYLRDHLAHAELQVIQGGSHLVSIDRPADFNAALSRFITRQEALV